MLTLINLNNGLFLVTQILQGAPDVDHVMQILYQAMMPDDEKAPLSTPHRPSRIQCDNSQLSLDLRPQLAEIGISIDFIQTLADTDPRLAEIESLYQSNRTEVPGLLSVPGVTPDLVEELFAAAANFYRAAPWDRLSNLQPLAVSFPSWDMQGYVQLMGNSGLEFGLVLFWDWDDLLSVYRHSSEPLDHIPASGWQVLSFESLEDLPAGDRQALKEYGWEAAGDEAYPYPTVLGLETVERPDRRELLAYTVIMRAIPSFIDQELSSGGPDDFLPAYQEWAIETPDGPVRIQISYPAGDLSSQSG